MLRMLRRIGQYLFCLMFVGIGLVVSVVFDRDDERWWAGPAFVGVGVLLIVVFSMVDRWRDRRNAILAHGVDGRGLVTEVKPTAQWESNDVRYFRLTMTIEVPGRAPYTASARQPYHRTRWDRIRPGIVVPVRVHPQDPARVMVATDWLNNPSLKAEPN
ncbi:hypothetical protein [Catellatospora citrea]|uniref:DUF3592 domain-containing protein n=1 Tax=Catellatospora citrea TaxID=53366 RepID=A0A8J3KI01_9ACTN|nr:hypothetical protein [Catellatospora citrea]RKE11889.1 hypothetical protein C8E86_6821 [Catellatospora citrea]GIG00223.1 hypothetical protein Cci01nite_53160 [Catellatospora citrea]